MNLGGKLSLTKTVANNILYYVHYNITISCQSKQLSELKVDLVSLVSVQEVIHLSRSIRILLRRLLLESLS